MEHTGNTTDNHSEANRKSSRVVDVSWAADYLDDAWENDHSAKGAYDTQVIPPLSRYTGSEPDQRENRSLSETQEFKAAKEDEDDDDVRIVDAFTDQTLVTYEERQRVTAAASLVPDEDDLKIRDAVTDQTVASVEDARTVRQAAARYGIDTDLDDASRIRDALSAPRSWKPISQSDTLSQTPFSNLPEFLRKPRFSAEFDEAPAVHDPIPEDDRTVSLPPRPEQGQTIVASKEAWSVRSAAFLQEQAAKTGKIDLNDLFREEEFFPEDDEEEYEVYEEEDDFDYDDYYGAPDRLEDPEDLYPEYDDDDYDRDPYDDDSTREDYDRKRNRRSSQRKRRQNSRPQYYYIPTRNPLRWIPLVLVIAICVFGFIAAMQICHDVPLNASDYSKVKYTVEDGLTDEQLAQDMEALGLIENPLVFRLRCKFYSADYVPGTYELSPCYSTEKIINILSGYTYGSED